MNTLAPSSARIPFSQFARTLAPSVLIGLVSWALFFWMIEHPAKPNFDEFHYVPAAKQWLALSENQNWEHPPLAKLLMAIGIGIFGDNPVGWRFMSTVFGSLTLVCTYLASIALFRTQRAALLTTIFTGFNFFLYVQARIGMLDTFMMAFLMSAFAAFLWTLKVPHTRQKRPLLFLAGASIGLAIACKWVGIIGWVLLLGYTLVFLPPLKPLRRILRLPEITGLEGVGAVSLILGLLLTPLAFYYLTFVPYLWIDRIPAYTLRDIFIEMQTRMYDGQLRVVTRHPYMSVWTDWPLMLRPIWYAFESDPLQANWTRGVFLVGNPLLMISGLLALLTCAWGWLKERSLTAFVILAFWLSFYLCWGVIPRKISFYYYYYPAAMILSFALTWMFERFQSPLFSALKWVFIGVTIGLFVYFYPILSGMLIPPGSFREWMWLGAKWI